MKESPESLKYLRDQVLEIRSEDPSNGVLLTRVATVLDDAAKLVSEQKVLLSLSQEDQDLIFAMVERFRT